MPLKQYGVLKDRATGARHENDPTTPHYQIHLQAGTTHYRIAVNVKSQVSPSESLSLVNDHFQHLITASLPQLPVDFTPLQSKPGGQAVDFIRGNLFNRLDMRLLPPNLPGSSNDLSDRIEHYVTRARQEQNARVYAFGQRRGPEAYIADKFSALNQAKAFTTFT